MFGKGLHLVEHLSNIVHYPENTRFNEMDVYSIAASVTHLYRH